MKRDELTMTLATNIQAHMERKGMNPNQLNLKAELNPTGVYDILSGKSQNPRLDTIAKIAKALGVPAAVLLEDYDAKALRSSLFDFYFQMDESDQVRLTEIAETWLRSKAN